jgi:hypothetical protein
MIACVGIRILPLDELERVHLLAGELVAEPECVFCRDGLIQPPAELAGVHVGAVGQLARVDGKI